MDLLRHVYGASYYALKTRWYDMMNRCYDDRITNFDYYGGKGITVCKRWHNFDNFYRDLKNQYDEKIGNTFLIRRDKSKIYKPSNCFFGNRYEMHVGRKDNIWVTINGAKMILSQASRVYGHNPKTVLNRVNGGWSVEKALKTKKGVKCKLITIDGVTKNIEQWLQHYDLSRKSYNWRRKHGMSEIDALTTPKKREFITTKPRMIKIGNKQGTFDQWLKYYGVTASCIYYRMKKHGITVEEAFALTKR
jgi:hypothetical protein